MRRKNVVGGWHLALVLFVASGCSRTYRAEEVSLGQIPNPVRASVATADGLHIGLVTLHPDPGPLEPQVGNESVILDGRDGPAFDKIVGEPVFSRDGRHFAYAAKRYGDWYMVVDGQLSPPCDDIGVGFEMNPSEEIEVELSPSGFRVDTVQRMAVFSDDSRRVAYVAKRGGAWHVVVDGQFGAEYDGIEDLRVPVFSQDGKHIAYVARRGSSQFAVVDGHEGPKYQSVNSLCLSPDGARVAYAAKTGGQIRAVVDGREGPTYDEVFSLTFSGDGKRLAYIAKERKKERLVIDGLPGPIHDYINGPSLTSPGAVFGEGGRHMVYKATDGVKHSVVVDGQPEDAYDEVGYLQLTPDFSKVIYWARSGSEYFIVRNGVTEHALAKVTDLVASTDGRHIAYVAESDEKQFIVVDGKHGATYDRVVDLRISKSGNHVAYLAKNGEKSFCVVDRRLCSDYTNTGYLALSPDGKHVAYHASAAVSGSDSDTEKRCVVVDGRSGPKYDTIITTKLTFDNGGTIRYLARRGKELFRTTHRLGW